MAALIHRKTGNPAMIAREAELLGAVRHPGVIELVGIEGDPRDPVLVTHEVEGRALSEVAGLADADAEGDARASEVRPPDGAGLSRAEVAGVMAAVASTLAEIHQLGVVHGAVAPEHIILGPGGRPLLCSFGYGGRVGETSPASPP